ncbi:XRE family transcriptional regulator [Muribacter muris]|uniref:XRE family transcriptional regulator n=1 Tax=Muribacter muris TaxID=67855 RepID=A0A4Y9K7L0_9PAST|nr:helix-turn-helix transcriptional regulator [Muribacter muris]MBF0784042.1 helix-turn-helix transcriptional regulator [Muribacter muris]MBF0827537.1 helix-turn-helix transcriptional regulator [Muribacter muris]TFV13100.1 XRE family transcriptional regulator [Muribacter muris]
MKINEKIRMLREENALSQEQMAEKMNISTNSYGKIERGETKLTLNKLEQIANIFNLDIVELISTDKNSYQITHYGTGANAFNFISDNKDIIVENEKLQLIIAHKNETIEHQKEEIILLRQMLELLKAN